jgi:nucleoside phosphorylase
MIAVISALEEEVRDFKRAMSVKRTSSYQCCRIYEGRCANEDVVLALTGVGGEHAKQVAQLILATYPVKTLISTGFCGSLNDKTRIGDVVVYSSLSLGGKIAAAETSASALVLDPGLAELAAKISGGTKCRTMIGNGVTIPYVCSTPEAKRRLGKVHLADVVDMESYPIGEITSEKKVAFIAARVVLDQVKDDLSVFDEITSSGKIVPRKVLNQMITHPSSAVKLVQFANNSRKARKNLALFLCGLIRTL